MFKIIKFLEDLYFLLIKIKKNITLIKKKKRYMKKVKMMKNLLITIQNNRIILMKIHLKLQ